MERIRGEVEMKTWTYSKNGICAVVSADNIEMAKHQLAVSNVFAKNEDLIPLPTHHRYCRILDNQPPQKSEEPLPSVVQ